MIFEFNFNMEGNITARQFGTIIVIRLPTGVYAMRKVIDDQMNF